MELGKLAHPTAEAEGSPALSLSSPEWWREEEETSNGRDPPVSGRVRRAAPARDAGSSRADLGHDQVGRPRSTVRFFPFPFCLKMLDL